MSETQQLAQLKELRELKVDQNTRALQRATAHVTQCEAVLAERTAVHDEIKQACAVPFEERFIAAHEITDPHGRLQAVHAKIMTLREQAAHAAEAEQAAAHQLNEARAMMAEASAELTRAQGRLTGVETLLDQTARKKMLFEEGQAEEAALDQFSARRVGVTL